MVRRCAVVVLASSALFACSHPDTVVHLTAPSGAYTVREPNGSPVCSLPCSIELDEHETVIVHHEGGRQFIVSQDALGKGVWTGSVRMRKEPGVGALIVRALAGSLVDTGTHMIDSRHRTHAAAGFVLTGIGTAGLLASERMGGRSTEELWLEKIANQ